MIDFIVAEMKAKKCVLQFWVRTFWCICIIKYNSNYEHAAVVLTTLAKLIQLTLNIWITSKAVWSQDFLCFTTAFRELGLSCRCVSNLYSTRDRFFYVNHVNSVYNRVNRPEFESTYKCTIYRKITNHSHKWTLYMFQQYVSILRQTL